MPRCAPAAGSTRSGRNSPGGPSASSGWGRLGSRVAAIGQAFEMNVHRVEPEPGASHAASPGVETVGKPELFARADVVTIHLKLSERPRGLVGAAELGVMKPTAYLVNTSRGPIVDEAALLAALRSGSIAGAGLDVYDVEPLPAERPLRSAPRTVLRPHLGLRDHRRLRSVLPRRRGGHCGLLARRRTLRASCAASPSTCSEVGCIRLPDPRGCRDAPLRSTAAHPAVARDRPLGARPSRAVYAWSTRAPDVNSG